ncbi:MAG TPA: L-erythro-3,5-diaminohexanoate dehydrogenase, partial [Pseudomonadota bacterium]|nr:L-erythro-3,5-diaminohexanoate dehydrogenase [Pseudomonadota bacterium]
DALEIATEVCAGGEFDLVISCVSAPRAEMAAIMCCRQGGTVYFFSMATSFTAAALGAEGISRDVDMLIGNGYCIGHAGETLELLGSHAPLRELFIRRYS